MTTYDAQVIAAAEEAFAQQLARRAETRCAKCQAVLHVGDFPFCRNGPADHARGVSTVVGDEVDFVQVNGLPQPRRFRSRLEHQRWLKEQGYRVYDTHVGEQGSDKSRHTRSAAIMDPQTLENGRYLVTHRAMIDAKEPDEPLHIRWVDEDTGL